MVTNIVWRECIEVMVKIDAGLRSLSATGAYLGEMQ